MEDWDKNPKKYLTNPDGSYILKKDGTPKLKPGRPKNSELSKFQLEKHIYTLLKHLKK